MQPLAPVISPLSNGRHLDRRIVAAFWVLALSLGALSTWANRHGMNSDGVCYLDMGEAYLRGDWPMAINAYWSPLYSWLLGASMYVLKPTSSWEFPVVHLVNFGIYAATLACFHFFLCSFIGFRRKWAGSGSTSQSVTLLEQSWTALGFGQFMYSSLKVIGLRIVTPDLCVSAFVYLLSGLVLRIRTGATHWLMLVLLGIVLGLAYYAKAPMFPLGFFFLASCMHPVENLRTTVFRIIVALPAFLLIASPLMLALTTAKHHLTFGDSARLNYAWYSGIPQRHWQGEPPESGTPRHPTRKIFSEPAVYEFATPVGGTYPPSYDPTYWYEGVAPRFSMRNQLQILASNAKIYQRLLFPYAAVLIAGCLTLLWRSKRRMVCEGIREHLSLILPAIAAMCMYWLVHVEQRFLGGFLLVLSMGSFSVVVTNQPHPLRRLQASVIGVIAIFMTVSAVVDTVETAYAAYGKSNNGEDSSVHADWSVAEGLTRMGVRPGDKIAVVGSGSSMMAAARLARVTIVAEIPDIPSIVPHGPTFEDGKKFWKAQPSVRSRMINAIAPTGAKAIIAKRVPLYASTVGWERVGKTGAYAYLLR